MSLPTTSTATPLFFTARPSWEDGIRVTQTNPTKVFTSRNGLEQRQAERKFSTWRMEYKHNPGSHVAARARLRAMPAEMAAPSWLPWWPEEYGVATTVPTGSGTFQLNTDPIDDFLQAGEYICFDGVSELEFRPIVSRAGRVVTLGGTGIAHPVLTRLWPCKLCLRVSPDSTLASDFTADEKIVMMTLQ